jgi:hypothetical protein
VRAELAEEDAKQPPAAGRNTLIQEFDQMIRTNTTRASLNLEPIAMFHDLLHLYLDVTSSGLRHSTTLMMGMFIWPFRQ